MASARLSKSQKIVVAAIDFGTTYSGYAFATSHDFQNEPLKIQAPMKSVGGSHLISLKTSTTLLLNPDETFEAFGFEAEDIYADLAADSDHGNYFYFRRFKMKLYQASQLKRDMVIEDDKKKTMNAIKVFSICIKHLVDLFMKNIKTKVPDINADDIDWVLTVPAIWNDGSKQFMREAAEKAGIKKNALTIALEPEAASLFCMHIPVDTLMDMSSGNALGKSQMSPFGRGTRYMVVDVGGGTVDITVHEVVDSGKLKELVHASGGGWGGMNVDAAFETFLEEVFGKSDMDEFKNKCVDDWLDMQRQFETKKRSIKADKKTKETLTVPHNLIEMFKKKTKKEPQDAIAQIKEFQGKLTWTTAGKLRIDPAIVRDWFKYSCDNTVQQVRQLLAKKECLGTKTILLVGGFAESQLLQEAMTQNFSDKRLIVPEDAGLAVLKGAVLFGHDPLTITARVAKVSYGIKVYRDFVDGQHPRNKRMEFGARVKCKDVFATHVQKGQELVVGQPQTSQRYTPLEADQISLCFDIYTSTEKDPQYVTDAGSYYIGQLDVDMPGSGKNRGVLVYMIFGGTEVTVTAKDERTNKVTNASFNFLQ